MTPWLDGTVLNREFSSPLKCEIENSGSQCRSVLSQLKLQFATHISGCKVLVVSLGKTPRVVSWLIFRGGEVERVSCDQMRLCLNNKNGTHGEFRCNWQRSAVGWWRILLQRPLALQQVSGEEKEGPYGPALPATHQPFVQLQMWGEGQEMK